MYRCSAEEIKTLYEPLFSIGNYGGPTEGFFRASWSEEEQKAFDYILGEAKKVGLLPRYDEVGNLALEQPGYQKYVEAGSHLDTVVKGGNFDGAAGIIAGLAAMQAVIQAKVNQKAGLRLRLWRGEESATYLQACKGSRAAFGKLPKTILDSKFNGRTLTEAIRDLGFTSESIEQQRSTISQEEMDGIVAHLELHIEQANALEQQQKDIGIVTSIRGPSRWIVSLEGRFDHSGGTPMGRDFRKDANLAMGYMLVELDKLGMEAILAGNDLVQTVGVINSDPQISSRFPLVGSNAIAKVSGFVYFSLDIRSNNKVFRRQYAEKVLAMVDRLAEQFGVTSNVDKVSETDPCESLDQNLQNLGSAAATRLGYSHVALPSGAVHDCLYVGEQKKTNGSHVPIGMIFIPCREGISHAPEEYASYDAIAKGANVLAEVFRELVVT